MINRSELVQQVLDGYASAIEAWAILDKEEKHVKECKEAIFKSAITEAENMGSNKFQFKEWEFEKRNGKKTFDFKHIQEWKEVKEKLEEIEGKYKKAWAIKTQSNINAVTDDGEVIDLPIVKYAKDSLIVKKL